jgi:hypothetical protein
MVRRGVTPLEVGAGGPETFSANGAAGGGGGGDPAGGGGEGVGLGEGAGAGVGEGEGEGEGEGLAASPPPQAFSAAAPAMPIDKLKKSAARCFTRPVRERPCSRRV